ncbi:MAG TPA: FKBP-type peptidyl-prolyl cis-trans isomerase [Lentimicrobium sp.]|jgi:FKBP-type peptidyl-prolyl cis-trans isomerase FkpA|nr:FKBP-type peptidyl-prolyl cis-trans isomerase [Lentimicrobium sp.]
MKRIVKRKTLLLPLLALIFIIAFTACDKEDDVDVVDDNIIQDYIEVYELEATKTGSGLYYVIEEPGTSQKPTLSSEVRVTYTGKLVDGDVFDSGTRTFALNTLIPGWQEGLQLFGKGGKGILLVPSRLGYGSNPPAGIPPNAVLIFNIYLIDVK